MPTTSIDMTSETTQRNPRRHPKEVIAKILKAVEWEELEKETEEKLRHELMYLLNDCSYRAPEQHFQVFDRLTRALETYLGEPDTDWKKKISNIIQNLE